MKDRFLVISRIGAYGMNALIDHLGMGTMVHKFIGEDPDAWCETLLGCKALINGRPVAQIYFDLMPGDQLPKLITIHIDNIYSIVRPKNIAEFDPREYGISPNNNRNWMGDKEPDLISDIHLDHIEEQIPGLFTKRKFLPQHAMGKIPKVKGAMDRRKYH